MVGIIFPAYIILTYKNNKEKIKANDKFRLVDYKQTILIFWGFTILILVNQSSYKQPDLNLYPKFSLINAGLTILVLGFAYLQYRTIKISSDNFNSIKERLKDIYDFLPKNHNELIWFSLLSVSAGVCEEIIFRLFLFEFLKEYTGLIMAFLTTNLIFTITHIGSGKRNLISSFILGLLFSVIYYFTNNIWIAVVLHVSIDINIGLLGYKINKTEKATSPNPYHESTSTGPTR